jgi:two-component system, NtrC family, sensor histidine kinase KinB
MKRKASQPVVEGSRGTQASLDLLYHVSREFAAALDLRTVLQKVLFLSMKTVRATSGSIIVLDDNGKAVESAIITGAKVHNHTTQRLRFTLEGGLAGWVVNNRQAALIEDSNQDSRWKAPPDSDSNDNYGTKAVVSAPLLVRQRLVGVMTLANEQPGYFDHDDLALVQAISDQAGIAVLNARLYEESQRQARVMTALAESVAAISASLDLEDVLVRILEQIQQALHVEAVALALVDSSRNDLVFQASIGWLYQTSEKRRLKIGVGIAGWAAQQGTGVIVPDVTKDERFDAEVAARTNLIPRAIACAPIWSRGEVIGVLETINPKDEGFNSDDLLVLIGIGSVAGTAINNAQLFARLEAAHERYRELFEDSIDPILITDRKGNILEANRQAHLTTNNSVEELRSMNIDQLKVVDQSKVGPQFQHLDRETTISYESSMLTNSGSSIPVQVYARQVIIESIPHIQWTLRDITERKNLDSLRDDLMSMAYHDLRSPLANVVSSIDAVGSILPPGQDPTINTLLAIARRSTERIERLTNSLLDISRLEAGQPIANPLPINPELFISEAVEIILPVSENKHQKLNYSIPPDLPKVSGDLDMLRRVVTNLLENAVKYTPFEGELEIVAQVENEYVHVWVKDTGVGIEPEQQEIVFKKFTRLNSSKSPKGLGLGLTFCRLAIEAHGGKIWVESRQGAGSRFIFSLPVAGSE